MEHRSAEAIAIPADHLADRVVLLTGAGSGIGAAVAVAAAAHGAQVMLLGRKVPPLEQIYDQIVEAGGQRPSIVPFDLTRTDEPAYEELANLIDGEAGRLDGLVHCAGNLDRLSPLEHWRYGDWHQIIQVHLNAAFALTRAVMPLLREADDASTIFTGSGIVQAPRAHWGAYAAAKAGLEAMATVLADETGPGRTTRVHCINPGPTRTQLRTRAYPAEDPRDLREPADVAWAYLKLLGPGAEDWHGLCLDLSPTQEPA
jgi:NAD(P)-dependent dehydrogenase (short-subunit alcohol dehydrogenase family)